MSDECKKFIKYIGTLTKDNVLESAYHIANDLYIHNKNYTYGIIMNEIEEYIFEN